MEDKKSISIGKLAALERAKALGLPVRIPRVFALEREAHEWKRRGKIERGEGQGLKSAGGLGESSRCWVGKAEGDAQHGECRGPDGGFKIEDPAASTRHAVSSVNEGFDWKKYQGEQDKGKNNAQGRPKNPNSASIWCMARKIMAKEWAMALGRGESAGSDRAVIERKAAQYRREKVAERERKEIEEQRANKQKEAAEEALRSFGKALLKAPKPVTPEMAGSLLEEAFTRVGEFISLTWQEDGCHILIEPWEEKRLRRKDDKTLPGVFQATVDDNLRLRSYERMEDPAALLQVQNDLILRKILASFRNSPQNDLHGLEDAVAEWGRIIQSTKSDGGFKIEVEPWEEMRRRNVERGGRPPVVTYVIKADMNLEHISCQRI